MRPIADAVVRAGLVDDNVLQQMARWGIQITAVPDEKILRDPQSVIEHIRNAIESKAHVSVDETDLDLLRRFLSKEHQKQGRLIVKEGRSHSTQNIVFCMTQMGECAIPWTDDEEPYVMVNGETHLKWADDEGDHDVTFLDMRTVSFGNKRMFVVCTMEELDDD